MGHHYTPREYLRGFQCSDKPGTIWMYDKKVGRFACPNIDKIAQEKGYYSPENEKLLNDRVERPANPVLQKLRRGEHFTDEERGKLAGYIATMLMRGPWRRQKIEKIAPNVADGAFQDIKADYLRRISFNTLPTDIARHQLALLEEVEADLRNDPMAGISDFVRSPWPTEPILALFEVMVWRVSEVRGDETFVTSDNPVWYDERHGMNKRDSEFLFPLAPNLAVFGSWSGRRGQTIFDTVRPAVVREVNRRTVRRAVRFVFSHTRLDWLPEVDKKQQAQLSRVERRNEG